MEFSFRCWLYSHLADLLEGPTAAFQPPEGPEGGSYPRTRGALALLAAAVRTSPADAMAIEQVRLFVNAAGGVPAPPYAAWYLDGHLGGPTTARVAAFYAGQGLEGGWAGQPADYLGAELEFLYFLCRHQAAARATGDGEALADAVQAEADFVLGHFSRWVPRFAGAIHQAGPLPAFGRLADVLVAFCEEETRRLASPTAPASAGRAHGAMERSS